MGETTGIEWTDATWNPVSGCTKVSPGCDHCYAETLAERFRGTPGHYYEQGFDVVLRPDKLDWPLRRQYPKRIFVNSMSDLFHTDIPDDYIARVFATMALAQRHTFQLLTKRPGRMRSLLSSLAFEAAVAQHASAPALRTLGPTSWESYWQWPLPNLWLGVSVENQQWTNRIPVLLETPAAVRWISAEPLLGPLDLDLVTATSPRLDWVVAGGESGHGARPMHPDWVRSIRDQCAAAEVPFLFKQWGEWAPVTPLDGDGDMHYGFPDGTQMRRVGKRNAGRELDGVTHDGYPPERTKVTM